MGNREAEKGDLAYLKVEMLSTAVCNDIELPSITLLASGVPGAPMHSLALAKVDVTEVAQLQ